LIRPIKDRHVGMQIFTSIQSIQCHSFPAIRLFGWFKRQVLKTEMRSLDNLGDLPLIVLTAGQTLDAAAMASIGFSGELDFEQIQQEWLVLQANLAGLSTKPRHIVLECSSHAIELDRPQAVIQAILEVVEIAR
jgi:hypothetical protein